MLFQQFKVDGLGCFSYLRLSGWHGLSLTRAPSTNI